MLQILLVVTVANLLWPWITYAALRFLVSGRRLGRVRRSQVLQCILYSFDASIWGAALFVVIALVATIPSTQGIYLFEARDHLWPWVLGLVLACYLLAVYRIMVGCKVYLQFRWPVLTVLGSQIIAFVVASFVPVFAYFVLG